MTPRSALRTAAGRLSHSRRRTGQAARALLQVIGEQVDLVEEDIAQLYDNWFIETCEDWVVPYIADLVGYRPVLDAGEPARWRRSGPRTPPDPDPAARGRQHDPVPPAQGHAGRARSAGQRRRRLAGAGGRVLHARRLDPGAQLSASGPGPNRRRAPRRVAGLAGSPFDLLGRNVDVRRVNSRNDAWAGTTSRASACSSGGSSPTR